VADASTALDRGNKTMRSTSDAAINYLLRLIASGIATIDLIGRGQSNQKIALTLGSAPKL